MQVYKAIAAVQGELAKEGIAKDRNNQQQGYKFRGIDDVYNALSPYLSKHGLCVLPRGISREITERVNAKGTALFYVTVAMEFDFVSSEDGSKHTIGPMYGEAMDSGDKATNKAMSAAYKYACMQAFCIPTEGDNDADSTTHEVQPRQQAAPQGPRKVNDAQRAKLFAEMGDGIPKAEQKAWMEKLSAELKAHFKVESSNDLPAAKFDSVLEWVREQKAKRAGLPE